MSGDSWFIESIQVNLKVHTTHENRKLFDKKSVVYRYALYGSDENHILNNHKMFHCLDNLLVSFILSFSTITCAIQVLLTAHHNTLCIYIIFFYKLSYNLSMGDDNNLIYSYDISSVLFLCFLHLNLISIHLSFATMLFVCFKSTYQSTCDTCTPYNGRISSNQYGIYSEYLSSLKY